MKTCIFQPFVTGSPFDVTITKSTKQINIFYSSYYHQDFLTELLPKVKAAKLKTLKKNVKRQKNSFEILKRSGTVQLNTQIFKDLLNLKLDSKTIEAHVEINYNKRHDLIEILLTIRNTNVPNVCEKIDTLSIFTTNIEDKPFVKMGLLFFNFDYIL